MALIILEKIGSERSKIYSQTKKQVNDLQEKYLKILCKWRFMHSGTLVKIPQYDGTFIKYKGIRFSGTSEHVFWSGFIEPYLKNEPITVLRNIAELSNKTNQNLGYCLDECEELLGYLACNVYGYMVETDQILKGNGITKGPKKDVSDKIEAIKSYFSEHRQIIELEFSSIHTSDNEIKHKQQEDIIDIKPNFCGIGVNFNAFFRKFLKRKVKKI